MREASMPIQTNKGTRRSTSSGEHPAKRREKGSRSAPAGG